MGALKTWQAALAVVMALGVAAVAKLPEAILPIGTDTGMYATYGRMILQGGRPYVDFYDVHPPLTYYYWALVQAISGTDFSRTCVGTWGTFAPQPCISLLAHALDLTLSCVAAGLAYAIARQLGLRPLVGVVAAVLVAWFANVSMISMEGSNPTKLTLVPSTFAVYAYLRARPTGHLGWSIVSGAAGLLAGLAKQPGLLTLVTLVAYSLPMVRREPRQAPRLLGGLALGAIVVLLIGSAYLAWIGSLGGFIDEAWRYNVERFLIGYWQTPAGLASPATRIDRVATEAAGLLFVGALLGGVALLFGPPRSSSQPPAAPSVVSHSSAAPADASQGSLAPAAAGQSCAAPAAAPADASQSTGAVATAGQSSLAPAAAGQSCAAPGAAWQSSMAAAAASQSSAAADAVSQTSAARLDTGELSADPIAAASQRDAASDAPGQCSAAQGATGQSSVPAAATSQLYAASDTPGQTSEAQGATSQNSVTAAAASPRSAAPCGASQTSVDEASQASVAAATASQGSVTPAETSQSLLLVWGIFSLVAIAGFREFAQVVPALALLAAVGFGRLWDAAARDGLGLGRPLAGRLGLVALFGAILVLSSSFQLVEWRRALYERGPAGTPSDPDQIAAYLRQDAPRGPIFAWGNAGQIYALSGRQPATRFVIAEFTNTTSPRPSLSRSQLIEDMQSHPPAVIVVDPHADEPGLQLSAFPALSQVLEGCYQKVPRLPANWGVFVETTSDAQCVPRLVASLRPHRPSQVATPHADGVTPD